MRRLSIAIALLASLSTTACSSDEPGAAGDDQASTDTAATAQPTAQPTTEPTPTSDPAAELGEPAAVRTASGAGTELELRVYPLARSGELAVLNFTLTLPRSAEQSFGLASLFTDHNSDVGDSTSFAIDGVQLTDTANGQLYLVASDGEGNCVCSINLGASLEPGDTKAFSATYAAPPEDVTDVNVSFPTFGTVPGVPVQ